MNVVTSNPAFPGSSALSGAGRTARLQTPAPYPPPGLEKSASISADDERRQQLTSAAERLVSQTFFGAMLRQMRNSPFKSELFSGGRGGEVFSEMQDQHMADRMARGAGRKLVESIVKSIEGKRARALASAESLSGSESEKELESDLKTEL